MRALRATTRREVEAGIAAVLGRVLGATEVPWDDIEQAPSPKASAGFSVRISAANESAVATQARGRKTTGIGMVYTVLVRFGWRLSPKARIESRRVALDTLDRMQTTIMSTTAPEIEGLSITEWSDVEGDQVNWRIWEISLNVATILDYPATAAA